MNKFAKTLVTVGILFVFFLLFALVVGGREASGHKTPGFFGLILTIAVYGAIRAIWKKKKNDENDDNGAMLQK